MEATTYRQKSQRVLLLRNRPTTGGNAERLTNGDGGRSTDALGCPALIQPRLGARLSATDPMTLDRGGRSRLGLPGVVIAWEP